jgi:hypothetical protein
LHADVPVAIVRKEPEMNIVVWKSPKALRGILKKLFGVKA